MFRAFLILLFVLPAQIIAQDNRSEYRVDLETATYFEGPGFGPVWFKANTSAYGIQGTRWVFDEFLPSNVYFSNKTIAPDRNMNYDCYMDQVVFRDSSGMHVLNKFQVDFIEFKVPGKDPVIFKKLPEQEEKDVVFMQILYEGKSSLYKRYIKKLVVKDEQPTFNYDDRYSNEYIIQDAYYMQLMHMKHVVRVPSGKRAMLKMMAPLEDAMKTFIKKEKINLKNEKELIRLIQYYDELTSNGRVT